VAEQRTCVRAKRIPRNGIDFPGNVFTLLLLVKVSRPLFSFPEETRAINPAELIGTSPVAVAAYHHLFGG
jgi:hypothetical protein